MEGSKEVNNLNTQNTVCNPFQIFAYFESKCALKLGIAQIITGVMCVGVQAGNCCEGICWWCVSAWAWILVCTVQKLLTLVLRLI
jgi:hypothetical protein